MNTKLFKLAKMILNLASVSTDKGELNYDGSLEVGTEVFVTDENGDFVPAADGEYITDDNSVIIVAEGKVSEIKPENEVIEAPAQEPENEPEHVQEVLEEPEQEPESAEPEQDEKDLKIAELEARIAELEAEKAELEAKLEEASAKEDELSAKLKMSAEEPAAKRAKKETKPIVKRSQYI